MEIQVLAASSPFTEFTFDSGTSPPYITAPSSPQRFGNFYFTNGADHHLDDLARTSFSISASLWEESQTPAAGAISSDDFKFALKLERDSASAEELFHSGKIKPLEPPVPPKSKFIRVSDILAEEEDDECSSVSPISSLDKLRSNPFGSLLATFSLSKGFRKWSLKDFLLFRSASEGRGTSKDPLGKYAARKPSLRSSSVEGGRGSSVSLRRRGGGVVSPHEMHYTAKREVVEEMKKKKKKTSLAYRKGLLGCLGFSPILLL